MIKKQIEIVKEHYALLPVAVMTGIVANTGILDGEELLLAIFSFLTYYTIQEMKYKKSK